VIAESTVTSSNFPTASLQYMSNLDIKVDPEKYIESCIQRTMPRDGRGLVVMWREELLYERQSEITDELIKTPFTSDQNAYMTRLESRMDPSAMTKDIRFALDSGPGEFEVYITSEDGSPVFIIAVQAGKTNTVQKMLQTGTDVNMKDNDGVTALMWAARLGHTKTVRLLLQAGADVNVTDWDGKTALMYAAWFSHTKIVRLLLQAGADVNAKTNYGTSVLWYAKRGRNNEIIKLIRQAKRK
jgi:hypothetical protein